jgi:hypothetical protein
MLITKDPVLRAVRDEEARLQREYDERYAAIEERCEIEDRVYTDEEAHDLAERRRALLHAQAQLEDAMRDRNIELER